MACLAFHALSMIFGIAICDSVCRNDTAADLAIKGHGGIVYFAKELTSSVLAFKSENLLADK